MTTAPTARLSMINLDSPDPAAHAEFWSKALGWEVTYADEDYGMIVGNSGIAIGFGRIEHYAPPAWPDPEGTKRVHLDLQVDDIDRAAEELIGMGATVAEPQPNPEQWTVMLDPHGLPFCLTASQG